MDENKSNPRKRKSDFKERKHVKRSLKRAKRRRLVKRSEPKPSAIEEAVPSIHPRGPAVLAISSIPEVQKVLVIMALANSTRKTDKELSKDRNSATRDPGSTEFSRQSANFLRVRSGNLPNRV